MIEDQGEVCPFDPPKVVAQAPLAPPVPSPTNGTPQNGSHIKVVVSSIQLSFPFKWL